MPKHVMLSYQWDHQKLVEEVYNALEAQGLPVWMDIKGGMKGNINDSMAEGVDNAACICPFMTPKYQESKNCKKELNYAETQDVSIVPIMAEKDWKQTGWLGVITAGLLWIDFRPGSNRQKSVESMCKEIMHACGNNLKIGQPKAATAAQPMKQVDLTVKPGRAFRHKLTGQFLAESGEVKFHPASGSRSSLVLRQKPEATSYWVEERKGKGSDIYYYKNYATNGYLGADGSYFYTKGQHYGAEEWLLMSDEKSAGGERAVVILNNWGKQYLAIRNGKLTGASSRSDDCVWILD